MSVTIIGTEVLELVISEPCEATVSHRRVTYTKRGSPSSTNRLVRRTAGLQAGAACRVEDTFKRFWISRKGLVELLERETKTRLPPVRAIIYIMAKKPAKTAPTGVTATISESEGHALPTEECTVTL